MQRDPRTPPGGSRPLAGLARLLLAVAQRRRQRAAGQTPPDRKGGRTA